MCISYDRQAGWVRAQVGPGSQPKSGLKLFAILGDFLVHCTEKVTVIVLMCLSVSGSEVGDLFLSYVLQ